jgi:polysaccharide biosynthesis/export protein
MKDLPNLLNSSHMICKSKTGSAATWTLFFAFLGAFLFCGCHSYIPNRLPDNIAAVETSAQLGEGDVIQINFPGATNLNTKQKVRRDGTINLPLKGDVKAAQKTLAELQKEISKIYEPDLQTQQVDVSLESSAVPVYVTGCVLRPGKILTDRPLTALEAIMEAGGFDQTRANLRKVTIVRYLNGKRIGYRIDLEPALKGRDNKDIPLQPNDIIFVPEKLQLF